MTTSTVPRLTHSEIKKLYTSGYKSRTDLKIGLEYERIPINRKTNLSVEINKKSSSQTGNMKQEKWKD